MNPAEKIAQAFHEAYERLAPEHGYETREASSVPWADVPEPNKGLMVAVARELLKTGVIHEGELSEADFDGIVALIELERFGSDHLTMLERLRAAGAAWRARVTGASTLLDVELTLARTMRLKWAEISSATGFSSSTLSARLDRIAFDRSRAAGEVSAGIRS